MSATTDHGYTVVQDTAAFVQRLSGEKLLKAQERLAFGLIKRSSFMHRIAPRTGIGPQHFPHNLQALIRTAETKTHEQIMKVINSHPEGEIANAYRKSPELSEGEAMTLARQIVLSVAHEQANRVDNKPNRNNIATEVPLQPKQAGSGNGLVGDARPGTTVDGTGDNESPAAKSGAERIREIDAVSLEPPRPLMRELPPADPFPIDALGDFLAKAARAIHDRVQAPLAICGQSVLAAATLAVQAHANVELPMGHAKPLSNYFVSIAASGERKTAVDEEALKPLRAREAELRDKYKNEMPTYQNDHLAWKKARDAKIKASKGDRAKIKAALDELGRAPPPPLDSMLTCGEPTFEGLEVAR